jgi:hypothetical protein
MLLLCPQMLTILNYSTVHTITPSLRFVLILYFHLRLQPKWSTRLQVACLNAVSIFRHPDLSAVST